MSSAPPCLVNLDFFQPVTPDIMDKALDCCRAATSSLDSCPAWLIKATRPITIEWATAIINGSFREGRVPYSLKETLIRPIRKKPSLAADKIGNYRRVANVSFISKVVGRVVVDQFQAYLDKTNALDPFQLGFRPRHGTETALITLYDDLLREADRGKISLLVLLNILAAFDTVDHGILLGRLSELSIGGLALAWFCSFLEDRPQRVQLGESISAPWLCRLWGPAGFDHLSNVV